MRFARESWPFVAPFVLLAALAAAAGRPGWAAGAGIAGLAVLAFFRDPARRFDGEAGVGYRLQPGYDLPPLMFDREEIQALVLGARIVAQFGDPALARASESILSKVAGVLPKDLEPLLADTRLFVPPTRSAARSAAALAVAREALIAKRRLHLQYANEKGEAKYIVSDTTWTASEKKGAKGVAARKVAKYGDQPWGNVFASTPLAQKPAAGNRWMEQQTSNDPFGSNPPTKLKPIGTALQWATNIGHPGPANPAESEIFDTFVLPTMFANAATGRMTPEESLNDTHQQVKRIFEKWRAKGLVAGGAGDK